MKPFKYASIKQNIQSATNEEQAKAKLQAEKDAAQDQVDAVLYQTVEKKNMQQPQKVAKQPEKPEKPKVKEPVKSDEHPPVQEVSPVKISSSTRFEDDAVDSFVNDMPDVAQEVSSEVSPETSVSSEPVSEPVEVEMPVSSDQSTDVPVVDMSKEAEEKRQENEAILREKTASSNHRNMVKPPKSSKSAVSKGQVSALKDFPTDLAIRAKQMFPKATTMNDAVAAYVYYHEGKPNDVDVSDKIKDIAETYIGQEISLDAVQDNIERQLSKLQMYDRTQNRKLEMIELALVYILFDRIGFRKKPQNSPGTIDFLETGVTDMINALEKQSDLKSARDRQRNGRPIT